MSESPRSTNAPAPVGPLVPPAENANERKLISKALEIESRIKQPKLAESLWHDVPRRVPFLPTILHRACVLFAQMSIGDLVILEPGVYIPRDVQAFTTVAGIPARVIGERDDNPDFQKFKQAVIEKRAAASRAGGV